MYLTIFCFDNTCKACKFQNLNIVHHLLQYLKTIPS